MFLALAEPICRMPTLSYLAGVPATFRPAMRVELRGRGRLGGRRREGGEGKRAGRQDGGAA